QNRAFAESDSPQLTQGWTPPAARLPAVGRATSRVDSAHSASRPPVGCAGRPRKGRPEDDAVADGHSGLAGHCGSVRGAAGGCVASTAAAPSSGATICHVGWRTTSSRTGGAGVAVAAAARSGVVAGGTQAGGGATGGCAAAGGVTGVAGSGVGEAAGAM